MSHYNVAPRWTGGSPAQVDALTAYRVVDEEQDAHLHALEGAYGAEQKRLAERPFALDGIVEYLQEFSDGWLVFDLITGEVFYRFSDRSKSPTRRQREKARERVRRELRTQGREQEAYGSYEAAYDQPGLNRRLTV